MPEHVKVIVRNKKARYEYHILDTIEAGIALVGSEVKSLRAGKANLADGYASIKNGEAFLMNFHISEFKQANVNNHEPTRPRKLLLHKKEIRKLEKQTNEKGNTIVPLSVYLKNGKVKVELAIARGKKLYDKRESIARKDLERDQARKIKL
ncbi:MAG: SsrA-binding protein SmpB [Ignavibacteriales bacterium]|nr:SsrA-binding protein SmpB [Ignavibacteriales bacterium]